MAAGYAQPIQIDTVPHVPVGEDDPDDDAIRTFGACSQILSKGWQRGGRWIDQRTPKLTPALSSKNPGLYGSQLTLGISVRLK
jgi:hypothetical protein